MERNASRATGACVGAAAPVGFAAMASSCNDRGLTRLASALVASAPAASPAGKVPRATVDIYAPTRARQLNKVADSLESPFAIALSRRYHVAFRSVGDSRVQRANSTGGRSEARADSAAAR